MNNEKTFAYTYSAQKNEEVLDIRKKYLPREKTGMDELKALDAKVKKPANVFGYVWGSVSAIIMGAGMSLVMTDVGTVIGLTDAMIPGIAVGIVGMGMALLTYPMFKGILRARKKKYGPKILALSEQLMQQ